MAAANAFAGSNRLGFTFILPDGTTAYASGYVSVDAGGVATSQTSTARLVSSAASTNPTLVKNSAGRITTVTGYNANAAARYLKLYNKASAPTVGTDTPIWTEYLPPQSKFTIPSSIAFSTGISYALTTGFADNDTGALTAGDIIALNIGYS